MKSDISESKTDNSVLSSEKSLDKKKLAINVVVEKLDTSTPSNTSGPVVKSQESEVKDLPPV